MSVKMLTRSGLAGYFLFGPITGKHWFQCLHCACSDMPIFLEKSMVVLGLRVRASEVYLSETSFQRPQELCPGWGHDPPSI